MSGYDPILGFTKKTYEEILASLRSKLRAKIASDLLLDDTDPVGQLLMSASDSLAEAWEVSQAAFDCLDPRNAEGETFTGVALLTGTARLPATRSKVVVNCTLTAGTIVPLYAVLSVAGKPTKRFRASATAYLTGNAAPYTAPGNGTYPVAFEGETAGFLEALSGTLTQIAVPVAGWSVATNAADASPGSDVETDEALAIRRQQDLDAVGSGNVVAVAADVLAYVKTLYPTGSVECLENTSAAIVDTMTPHSIEVIVDDNSLCSNAEIARIIFESKGAGIATNGNLSEVVTDSNGRTHVIKFRRVAIKQAYLTIEATYNTALLATPGMVTDTIAAIKAALVTKGLERRRIGLDVTRAPNLGCVVTVPGVVDVTRYAHALGAPPGPGESVAALTILPREVSVVQSANVSVTLTAAVTL